MMDRLTKLICTVGPASAACSRDMVEAGMDIARLNFSHGNAAVRQKAAANVRDAASDTGRPVGLLADLSGPKMRLGKVAGGRMQLEEGSRFVLGVASRNGDACSSTNYPRLLAGLKAGDLILLSDGSVQLSVVESAAHVVTEVIKGGEVRSGAGMNIAGERLSMPALTRKDRADLPRAIRLGADFVAQSFVRRAADVQELRKLIGQHPVKLIAKVETRGAVEEVDPILDCADGIMVARGDLGAEIPFEQIPAVQRYLVGRANAAGKPVVVATEMLQSMTGSSRPTRAEVTDVANAACQGAAAVLLSSETAVGANPVGATQAAARILDAADPSREWRPESEQQPLPLTRSGLQRPHAGYETTTGDLKVNDDQGTEQRSPRRELALSARN